MNGRLARLAATDLLFEEPLIAAVERPPLAKGGGTNRPVGAEKPKMTLALKRVKVYLKLIATCTVVVIVLLVVLMNRSNTADVWFFGRYRDVNVVWLIAVTSVSSVLGWWGVRRVFRVVRELREVRRARRKELQLDEQRRLADELAEREKKIDEKIRRSITEEP